MSACSTYLHTHTHAPHTCTLSDGSDVCVRHSLMHVHCSKPCQRVSACVCVVCVCVCVHTYPHTRANVSWLTGNPSTLMSPVTVPVVLRPASTSILHAHTHTHTVMVLTTPTAAFLCTGRGLTVHTTTESALPELAACSLMSVCVCMCACVCDLQCCLAGSRHAHKRSEHSGSEASCYVCEQVQLGLVLALGLESSEPVCTQTQTQTHTQTYGHTHTHKHTHIWPPGMTSIQARTFLGKHRCCLACQTHTGCDMSHCDALCAHPLFIRRRHVHTVAYIVERHHRGSKGQRHATLLRRSRRRGGRGSYTSVTYRTLSVTGGHTSVGRGRSERG